jgi:hypothetical protein
MVALGLNMKGMPFQEKLEVIRNMEANPTIT